MHRVSGVIIDIVKYACKDVFIVDYLYAEVITLFFSDQIYFKYKHTVASVW